MIKKEGLELKGNLFKQTLIPLTSVGSTVIFKNRFYGSSTSFTLDEKELEKVISHATAVPGVKKIVNLVLDKNSPKRKKYMIRTNL